MNNELDAILKQKLEAGTLAQAEEAKKEQERQAHEAKLSERLTPALEIIESELAAAADVLRKYGYKSVTIENPGANNKWQGRELRVKLNDDPRTPGLRYFVYSGRIYASTKVTEMGEFHDHESHLFTHVIRDVRVDQLQGDEELHDLVKGHIKKFVEALPAPTGTLAPR